jgi:hypothetical protein
MSVRSTIRVGFSAPDGSAEEAWAHVTASLAAEAGIADVDGFREALVRGLAATADYGTGGGMVRTDDGRHVPVGGAVARDRKQAGELVAQLQEVLARAEWPIGRGPQADDLRAALGRYESWLTGFPFATKATRSSKKPKAATSALAMSLAEAWPRLTGERPHAWRSGDAKEAREPGGRFFLFLRLVCERLDMNPPSVPVVEAVLRHLFNGPR